MSFSSNSSVPRPAAATSPGRGWGLEFYDCVINNDLARLETLVEQHKIDLNAKFTEVRKKNHLDLSPVHLVAYKGFTGMLQYLYDMKCNIHQTTATLRRTAFHFAVLRHKMACFHKLLSFGANPDPRDTFGNSPCHYAAEDGACDILRVLLQHDIDLNAQDITLKTPLMKATRNGKVEAVKLLLHAGCAVNMRDKNGDTALHFAARHGGVELVEILVRVGSDVGLQNQWGHSALMEAVSYNNKDASGRLLRSRCDVNLREYKGGDTALHVAVRKNYNTIVEQLLSTESIKHVYNYQGELAILDAIVNHKIDTIRIFLHYNYDFDVPVKLDYDGTGGKTIIRVALERGHFDLLRLFGCLGYLISTPTPPRPFELETRAGGVSGFLANHQAQTAAAANAASQQASADSEHAAAVKKFLQEVKGVRLLREICRRTIRKHLSFGIREKARRLRLPEALQNYILLQDMI